MAVPKGARYEARGPLVKTRRYFFHTRQHELWPPHLSVHETDARAPRAERRKNKGPLAIEGLY